MTPRDRVRRPTLGLSRGRGKGRGKGRGRGALSGFSTAKSRSSGDQGMTRRANLPLICAVESRKAVLPTYSVTLSIVTLSTLLSVLCSNPELSAMNSQQVGTSYEKYPSQQTQRFLLT